MVLQSTPPNPSTSTSIPAAPPLLAPNINPSIDTNQATNQSTVTSSNVQVGSTDNNAPPSTTEQQQQQQQHEHYCAALDRSDRSLTSISLSLSTAATVTSKPKSSKSTSSIRRQSLRATRSSQNSSSNSSLVFLPPTSYASTSTYTAGTVSSSYHHPPQHQTHHHLHHHPNQSNQSNHANLPYETNSKTKENTNNVQALSRLDSLQSFHYPKRHKVPKPRNPVSSCPLLCVFYAEFDNIVGPKICFQSPPKFMDCDIGITPDEIDALLEKMFCPKNGSHHSDGQMVGINDDDDCDDYNDGGGDNIPGGSWNGNGNGNDNNFKEYDNAHVNETTIGASSKVVDDNHNDDGMKLKSNTLPQQQMHSQNQNQTQETSYSIFDSTSEYIITGHEMLTGQIISLSTHNMHILSYPVIIQNTQYERNSLLFSVGFVIRRMFDPIPFRPILSKLTSTFQSMELESAYLTDPKTRNQLQMVLDSVLRNLNSPSAECHLLLNDANMLHLQYFPPPKVQGPIVPDYVVPVLLRPESQLQSLDWDLTINWIVPHIDGIKYVKLISESSQVDPEGVRASLRVLRHHHAVACVDIFRYENIYVCTAKAQRMLAGGDEDLELLLEEAYKFVVKQSPISTHNGNGSIGGSFSGGGGGGGGPYMNIPTSVAANAGGGTNRQNLPYPPISFVPNNGPSSATPSGSPSNSSANTQTIRIPTPIPTPTTPTLIHPPLSTSCNTSSTNHMNHYTIKKREKKSMMKALAILYTSCQKDVTIGDVWVNKLVDNTGKKAENPNEKHSSDAKTQHFESDKKDTKKRSTSLDSISSSGGYKDVEIDWKEVFEFLDHIRFVTFGVIHGLIQRLHEYPVAYNVINSDKDNNSDNDDDDNNDNDSSSGESFQLFDEARQSTSHFSPILQAQQAPSLPSLPSLTSLNFTTMKPTPVRSSMRLKDESKEKNDRKLALEVASCMDGQKCDDELSCLFQRPIGFLKDLVINKGKKEVISIYQR